MMELELKSGYDEKKDISILFTEYTTMLVNENPNFAKSLKAQNYDSELDNLRAKYGPPDGRLYIAYANGKAAGCAACHRFDNRRCELKRLYVSPQYRGHHLASILIDKILEEAKKIGYKSILLDTLPFLKEAIFLYKNKYKFREIPKYYDTPIKETIFMEKIL
ncbi:GNAT family N-acetyltransferase [Pectinatus haikarae]|uniref:Ribosomal protein S18 acetylase RimI-like enzyme n=1 Tax=Pectinatus haikarae TaxID=349096 RepID=A0ABT9Y839_9FIRM|nr:GNAT family N-acetyltransferase [Pectinatus haikarae]MDQ0203876.1 ribosomal protein S18 acetylase RimI-like enzyme [Pectinatus haikarae]